MVREKQAVDFGLIAATMLLVAVGVLFIYDASFVRAGQTFKDPQYFLKRQFIWAGVGLLLMSLTIYIPYWKLHRVAVGGMAVSFLTLLAVLSPLGRASHGAQRWIPLGPLSFQPSEFAKVAMVLYLAWWITRNHKKLRYLDGFLFPAGVMAVTAFLVVLEHDLGTALTIAGTGVLMLFLGGARKRHLAMLGILGVVCVLLLIIAEPYRHGRIKSWRDPFGDPQGASYQVVHSLIALGSGGPLGLGLGQGRQKYFYLPAEHTDYILGTIGEETGLWGTLLILGLFTFVAGRGFSIAHRTKDPFGSLLASGLSTMVAVQAILNVGVVTSTFPSTGVPLPFISYGGSSLVFTMISMGLLVGISQYPTAAAQTGRESKDANESAANRRRDGRTHLSGARNR